VFFSRNTGLARCFSGVLWQNLLRDAGDFCFWGEYIRGAILLLPKKAYISRKSTCLKRLYHISYRPKPFLQAADWGFILKGQSPAFTARNRAIHMPLLIAAIPMAQPRQEVFNTSKRYGCIPMYANSQVLLPEAKGKSGFKLSRSNVKINMIGS